MDESHIPDRLDASIIGLKLLHCALWAFTIAVVCIPTVHAYRPPVMPHALAWVPGVTIPVAIAACVAALVALSLARAPKSLVASIALIGVGAAMIVQLALDIDHLEVMRDRHLFSAPRGVVALVAIACGTALARLGLRSLVAPVGIDLSDVARLGRRVALVAFVSIAVGVALPLVSPPLARCHVAFKAVCVTGIAAAAFATPAALAAHALGRLLAAIDGRGTLSPHVGFHCNLPSTPRHPSVVTYAPGSAPWSP